MPVFVMKAFLLSAVVKDKTQLDECLHICLCVYGFTKQLNPKMCHMTFDLSIDEMQVGPVPLVHQSSYLTYVKKKNKANLL